MNITLKNVVYSMLVLILTYMIYKEICKICKIKREYYEVNWFGNSMLSTLEAQQKAANEMITLQKSTKKMIQENVQETFDEEEYNDDIINELIEMQNEQENVQETFDDDIINELIEMENEQEVPVDEEVLSDGMNEIDDYEEDELETETIDEPED